MQIHKYRLVVHPTQGGAPRPQHKGRARLGIQAVDVFRNTWRPYCEYGGLDIARSSGSGGVAGRLNPYQSKNQAKGGWMQSFPFREVSFDAGRGEGRLQYSGCCVYAHIRRRLDETPSNKDTHGGNADMLDGI